jgi:hypothetical protein
VELTKKEQISESLIEDFGAIEGGFSEIFGAILARFNSKRRN